MSVHAIILYYIILGHYGYPHIFHVYSYSTIHVCFYSSYHNLSSIWCFSTDYSYYETEYDNSPRYTFANVHADDEMPAMTTFNQGSEFQDGPSLEATGYVNPAFRP